MEPATIQTAAQAVARTIRVQIITPPGALTRSGQKQLVHDVTTILVKNARAFLAVQKEFGSFDAYCWQFVDGRPRQNRWSFLRQIPATTAESDAFSRDLKRRGFSFVGSTVIYAHMQAVGMVNDSGSGSRRGQRVRPRLRHAIRIARERRLGSSRSRGRSASRRWRDRAPPTAPGPRSRARNRSRCERLRRRDR
jgi:methyladenine glycosylase